MTISDELIHDVVSALAEADRVTPQELGYLLAEYIDPEMLGTLVSRDVDGELTFQVPRHEVTVTSDGEIFIDGIQYRREQQPHPPNGETIDPSNSFKGLHFEDFFGDVPCTVYQSRNEPGWPIDFISENCRELTGYDPNAFIVGGVDFGFDLIHPDDRENVSEIVENAVQNEEPFSVIYRIQTADGTEKWVLERGIGRFDEPEPISFIGVIVDVTDLKGELDVPEAIRA